MQATIELIRIDNRLVHGQVGVTWANALNIDTIVVVDDESATNIFSQKMMKTIAKTSNVGIRFYSVNAFVQVLRIFVVVRDIHTVYLLYELGLHPQKVNIGNLHYEKGKVPYNKKMYITERDAVEINTLLDHSFKMYYQDVPNTFHEVIEHIDFERLKKVRK